MLLPPQRQEGKTSGIDRARTSEQQQGERHGGGLQAAIPRQPRSLWGVNQRVGPLGSKSVGEPRNLGREFVDCESPGDSLSQSSWMIRRVV
jgi:hypothetical protein